MRVSRIQLNGIGLEYESFGHGEPLVLIMGIASQLIFWPESFCTSLSQRGFEVIRFDHRDVGLSSHVAVSEPIRIGRLMWRRLLGLRIRAPYTLEDMANDVGGLISALGLESAHVVGISMGGMIGQVLALRHPQRVRTLTSIMSHSGSRLSGLGSLRALRVLCRTLPADREGYIEWHLRLFRTIGSSGFAFDAEAVRELAGLAFDREPRPKALRRHLAAILASGSRRVALRSLRVPTLIVHGTADRLVRPRAARALARTIPQSSLLWIEGLGHDLPRDTWETVIEGIDAHAHAGSGEREANPQPNLSR
jgi:pimeloyl-ACP methyl ester carboxylesterase